MGYDLKTLAIEPLRSSYDRVVDRFGDKPATRYQEATFEFQQMENFHYKPLWDPDHDIYDPDYSAVKLTDPYTYTDPRQYYYNTYVTARADLYDGFGKDLKYIEDRDLFSRLPENWRGMLVNAIIPLRHYEGGAQMICSNGARFAWGSTVSTPVALAGMDRLGNAQLLSMVGLSMGGGSGDKLAEGKQIWMDAPYMQGLRRLVEEALVAPDWVDGLLALEMVDAQLYPLLFRHCDDRALFRGAMAYSLIAQHFSKWYTDQQKWLTALMKAWVADPQHGEDNRKALGAMVDRWYPQAQEAVASLAEAIESNFSSTSIVSAATRYGSELAGNLEKIGIPLSVAGGLRS